jgi:transposase
MEQIHRRAEERVQAGESPEALMQALRFLRSCIYNWLARYRAGGKDGLKAVSLAGRPKKSTGQ